MQLGAQLYTVRDYIQTEKDFRRTMEKIAKIGYRTVQISAVGPIGPKVMRQICDEFSLRIVVTHTNPDRIINETEQVIEEHDILGCQYIGIGMLSEKYRKEAWYGYFAEDYKEAAQKIAAHGKRLLYHNHNFEFTRFGGKNIFEHMLEDFAPDELQFILDTYWIQAGGGDVVQWIKKLSGRVPCVHLKDMHVDFMTPIMAPVGEGNMNFEAILKACEEAGTEWLLVEQDICAGSPFDCLKTSYQNLVKMGYR
jgi:sugar phosphate isomerase/epimerase